MTQEQPIFSIVMPVYGVEDYIAQAISCIQAQTCPAWELICVDDATPDASARIAEQAAQSDERIRVVHHDENKGLSEARNTGMAAARGTYLWMPDPDDTYEPTLLQDCLDALRENPAHVTFFGVDECYFDAQGAFLYNHAITPARQLLSSAAELRPHVVELERQTLLGYAWNKIYDLAYLRTTGARFETVKLIEDITFNVAVFQNLNSLNVLASAPYHYARRLRDNLTNKFIPDYYELHRRRIGMLADQQRSWGTLDGETRATLGSLFARYVLSALERNCDPQAHMSHADRKVWIRKTFSDELYRDLIPHAQAQNSRALALCLRPLKARRTGTCLALGRLIHIARGKLLPLFTRIKSGR